MQLYTFARVLCLFFDMYVHIYQNFNLKNIPVNYSHLKSIKVEHLNFFIDIVSIFTCTF